jgi:outer membrane receptor protein involved in Fe transport
MEAGVCDQSQNPMKLLSSRDQRRKLRALLAGALTIAASSVAIAQQTAQPNTGPAGTAAPVGTAAPEEKAIQLSPFQVNSSRDRGYFASSSLSGTRLNSSLKDLASSITVVTKTQLNDTAAIDINDIFLYEANTEGMFQYTDFVQDRTFYNETTTLAPQSANRIRGVGQSNPARDGFASSSLIPIDSYNIENVEINRGPNANIFGLGNASGTVNINTINADPSRELNEIVLRGDSTGGWRTQADFNRPLIKDVLGLRLTAVHDDKGFERKPAYESINRLNAALTYKPFKSTTIRGKYESYSNHYNRANTTLPRDSYSEWMNNGMPVWNPNFGTTGGWRYLNGSTYTGVSAANETAQLPLGFVTNNTGFWGSPSAYVVNGVIERYEMNRANNNLTSPGIGAEQRYVQTGDIIRRGGNALGYPPLILFQSPSITDKSQYDYTDINFLAPNYGIDKGDIYEALLEQDLLRKDNQSLTLQLGFYREEISTQDHNYISKTDGATPYVTIDVNEFFIDGTPNPYFLRPYIGANQPRINIRDETNDHSRANLAYQLDLTKNTGWTRWLGRHNVLGYAEFRESYGRNLIGGDRNISDYSWTSANDRISLPLRGNTYRLYPRYYVGGKITDPGPVIDYAPQAIKNLSGNLPFNWYGTNGAKFTENAELEGLVTGGNALLRQIRSKGAVWQGFFWKDRIVPTFGWREDVQRERASRNLNANVPGPTQLTSTIDIATRRHRLDALKEYPADWVENSGRTKTAGLVVHPLSWLSLHYNKSDSFKPEPIRYDIKLNQVPNPTGKGEDYGFTVDLFDGKLVAKLNRYELEEKNSRSGATSGAFAARTFRFFFDADTVLTFNNVNNTFDSSDDPWDLEQQGAQWAYSANPGAGPDAAIAAGRAAFLAPFGFDSAYIDRVREIGLGNFAEVNTVISKGYELEVNYNPTRYWTLKFTAAQQEAIDSELSRNISGFFEDNIEALKAIVIPSNPYTLANGTAGKQWWTSGATSPTSTATPQNFYFVNILTTLRQAAANENKPRPQTREYRFAATTNYKLAGFTSNKWLKNASIGGSLRWEDKASVGFFGLPSTDPDVRGAIVEYDNSRPIYDKARVQVDLMAAYNFRMFSDKVHCKLQLNVQNVLEDGRLQPFVYNPDGSAWNYRIIDPRRFVLTASFDL